MRQVQNPIKIKQAVSDLSLSSVFSRDYTSVFILFEYEKDEFLIREGYKNNYLFFLWKGNVKCFSYSANGKTQFITYHHPADSFGLVGSIWGNPAVSNIQAIEKCLCLALPLSNYRKELLDDNRFLRYLCRQLGNLVYNNNSYLQISQCTSTESMVASLILASAQGDVCHINLSETAEVAGPTYRHVLRILNKFCSDGLLEKQGRHYLIKDKTCLSLCAEDSFDYVINGPLGVS